MLSTLFVRLHEPVKLKLIQLLCVIKLIVIEVGISQWIYFNYL